MGPPQLRSFPVPHSLDRNNSIGVYSDTVLIHVSQSVCLSVGHYNNLAVLHRNWTVSNTMELDSI